jgi:methyl coenzyme M reductase subunit D
MIDPELTAAPAAAAAAATARRDVVEEIRVVWFTVKIFPHKEPDPETDAAVTTSLALKFTGRVVVKQRVLPTKVAP